jgi:transcription termination factor Rho
VKPNKDPENPRRPDALDAAARNEMYEEAKRTDYEIPKLQALPMAELIEMARDAGVEAVSGVTKQELIFQILKLKVTSQGLGWGEGTLDILPDGFGFLRSARYNYRSGPDDIYVSPSQIRRLNLKQGHQLAGPVRPPKEGEKYFALLHVEAVNGALVESLRARIPFEDLTPVLPNQRLLLEHPGDGLDMRLIDILAPLGKGQRVLMLSPPHSSRTRLLTNIARAILANDEDVYVILLLLDERPEEVTEARRRTGPDRRREVIASTFDEPASRHVALAEMAMHKAMRMVESRRDVAVVLDSLTALTRAYNTEVPHSGKIVSAGLDVQALHMPKQLFGAARRVEEGGSMTVIATSLTGTGSHMDEVICEEFRGKSNSEIVLDQELASMHVYPALDVHRTGTRREDTLLETDVIERLRRLRKRLAPLPRGEALEQLVAAVEATGSNREFLATL